MPFCTIRQKPSVPEKESRIAMNNTRIEWSDMTWNPVTGCRKGCRYCYARDFAHRFKGCNAGAYAMWRDAHSDYPEKDQKLVLDVPMSRTQKDGKVVAAPFPFGFEPTFHRYRLDEPAKTKQGKNIFVCSMSDLFGPWIPNEWISTVMDACLKAPQHRYIFLTKFPARYMDLAKRELLPDGDNFWYGTTITSPKDTMLYSDRHHTFASIEPLLEPFGKPSPLALTHIDWFIVGAETGNHEGKVTPEKEWVENIVQHCDAMGKPVFMKDSLLPVVGEDCMRRDFPWEASKW